MKQNGTISLYINITTQKAREIAKFLILSRDPSNIKSRNELMDFYPKAKKVFKNDDITVEIISCVLMNNWIGIADLEKEKDAYVIAEYYKHPNDKWDSMLNYLLPSFKTMKVVFRYTCTRVLVAPSEICYFLKDYLEKQPSIIGKEENYEEEYDVIMINKEIKDRTATKVSYEETTHENAVLEGLKRMREFDKHGCGLCYRVDGVDYTTDEIINELENNTDIGKAYSNNVYDLILTYMGKFSQDAE